MKPGDLIEHDVREMLVRDPRVDDAETSVSAATIEDAFERNAKIDPRRITVATVDGTVTLSELVASWAERNAALDAVWTIPGVEAIDDQLVIAG